MSDYKHCDNDNPDETNPELAPFIATRETTTDQLLAAWKAGTIDYGGTYMLASMGYKPALDELGDTETEPWPPKTGRSDVWWSRLNEYLHTTKTIAERRGNVISESVVLRGVIAVMNDIERGLL